MVYDDLSFLYDVQTPLGVKHFLGHNPDIGEALLMFYGDFVRYFGQSRMVLGVTQNECDGSLMMVLIFEVDSTAQEAMLETWQKFWKEVWQFRVELFESRLFLGLCSCGGRVVN